MSSPARFEELTVTHGDRRVVDGLSFEVREGEACAVVGPDGAGKTTALRALLGRVPATAGATSLLGARPGTPEFDRALRRVGTSLDEPALLDRPPLVVLDEPTDGLGRAEAAAAHELIRELPGRGTSVLVSTSSLDEARATCDRVVVLQWGRPVAAGTLPELLSRGDASHLVVVDPARVEKAIAALNAVGLTAAHEGDGSITVIGEIDTPDAIRGSLYAAGIHVWELRPG